MARRVVSAAETLRPFRRSPFRRRIRLCLTSLALGAAFVLALAGFAPSAPAADAPAAEPAKTLYTCGMHPQVIQDKPGNCPICGMKLTPIRRPTGSAAATAALDAVFPAAGQPHIFEELAAEGLKAHKVRKVYITAWGNGDTFVSIDETIDLKIEALKQHKSQMKDWDPSEMVKNWAAETARGKEMAFAESFRVITLMSDEDWQKYLTSNESTAQTSPAAAD